MELFFIQMVITVSDPTTISITVQTAKSAPEGHIK